MLVFELELTGWFILRVKLTSKCLYDRKESLLYAHSKDTDPNCEYRKVPKFSDARKLCCILPKIQTKRPKLKVFHQNDANGIANSEDSRSSLIWVCTFCPDLSVQKLMVVMVSY